MQLNPSKYPPTLDGNKYLAILKPVYSTIMTSNNLCKRECLLPLLFSSPDPTRSNYQPNQLKFLLSACSSASLYPLSCSDAAFNCPLTPNFFSLAKFLPSFPLFAACVAFAARSYISHQHFFSLSLLRKGEVGGRGRMKWNTLQRLWQQLAARLQ